MDKKMIAAYVAVALLGLAGCSSVPSSPTPSEPAAIEMKTNTEQSIEESSAASQDLLQTDERRLVLMFQFLQQMDKKEGLAITAQQAEKLLPMVKGCSSKGHMLTGDQKNILELLYPAQRQWYDELQEKHRSKIEALKKLSPEEREQMIKEYEMKRKQESEQPEASVPESEQTSGVSAYGGFNTKNIEQQLIELLESRRM
jgi:hypothetical protein